MLRRTLLTVCCLMGATCAFADIHVWEGSADDCTIYHDNNTITINEPGTYGFRAWDTVDTLEEIQSITVNSNVTGDVTVTIAWDEYGGDGATDLWEGNLTHGTYAVELAGLEISGSLGTTAAGFTCEDVTGDIDIGGNVATAGDVTFGDVSGDIDFGGGVASGGDVNFGDVSGYMDILDSLNGVLQVNGDLCEIQIGGEVGSSGRI